MASPLTFRGGFQLTQFVAEASAALRWRKTSPGITVDTVYTQHIALQFGGHNLQLTPSGGGPPPYNANRMFLMFG